MQVWPAFATSLAAAMLSPQAQALLEPIHQAYVHVEAEHIAQPAPKTPSDRLMQLLAVDQAGRTELNKIDFAKLPKDQRQFAWDAAWSEIREHDLEDQRVLKSLIPADGWFKRSVYGGAATRVAFLVVQHATNDPALMHQALAKLGEYVSSGEAKGADYALLYDRVALDFDHKPQRFGSKVSCLNGVWTPVNLEDPDHVDDRRRSVGLTETEADYLKHFASNSCQPS